MRIKATALVLAAFLAGPTAPVSPTSQDFVQVGEDGEPFLSDFNAFEGVRLVMYVSPTCGGCLLGARVMQDEVLTEIDDARLRPYVIWARKNGGEPGHLERVADLVHDDRAVEYWDDARALSNRLDQRYDLAGPCAGVFALYAAGQTWQLDDLPEPAYWQDAHANQRGRQHHARLDAEAMRAEIARLMRDS